ncbi:4-hydroxyphenylacetate 3-monooxygenase, oxygenase component [Paenibacillus sp. TRM 82003]|nr:4-hydroxyphenylacetate 3-monooxygenase, oxygenase component [Paenibacillus sp. TRM 82003]
MPARNGTTFVQRLDRMHPAVWIDGARVRGPISEHPAFAGLVRSKAALYDLQHDPALRERMTYASPTTGDRVGLSFLPPQSADDLVRRRLMSREWALSHAGWMGRAPDYTNTMLMTFASAAPLFAEAGAAFGERIQAFYERCREEDLSMAHTFIRPPADRLRYDAEEAASGALPSLAVVEERADGLVVDGARLMATQGGITDELLLFPSYVPPVFAEPRHPLVFAFAVSSDAPGVSFHGRTPYAAGSAADAPLASRFDEIDMTVRFDRVFVPWERVFLYGDAELANRLYEECGFYPMAMHQVLTRLIVKFEFFAALAKRMMAMLETTGYASVRDTAVEAIAAAETLRALQLAAEAGGAVNRWGVYTPSTAPLYAAFRLVARTYPPLVAAVQRLGASHLVANASEGDLADAAHGDWLRAALAAPDGVSDGAAKSRLFRLAWDACAGAFAGRQTIYEQFFFGDPARLADKLYEETDTSAWEARLERFVAAPEP